MELGAAPDVVGQLVESFLAGVPSPRHRLALECVAHARLTTAGLLGAVFGDREGEELFSWLRGLSFMEHGPYGLFPHDLAREVIDADLRWRDPAAYREVHSRVRRHVVERIWGSEGRERGRALADLIFLHRANPAAAALWDWKSLGEVYADGLRGGDAEAIVTLVERYEGAESAAIANHWLERQPAGFYVFRGRGPELLGFAAHIALHEAGEEDLARDPGARAAWAHAQRHAPPRPGDEVLLARFLIDRDVVPGAVALVQRGDHAQHAGVAGAPASFLVLHRGRRSGGDGAADGLHPLRSGCGGRLRGRRAELRGVRARLAAGRRRGMARADGRTRARRRRAGAGRRAARPGRCWRSRSRSSPTRCDGRCATCIARARWPRIRSLGRVWCASAGPSRPAPEALRELLHEAVDELRADPRGEKLVRALERTYLRPAPTQEAAAELLGLPFSTYRGHLTRGLERVVDWLWQRELYGAGA